MRCRREGAGDHEALEWEAGVSPGAQPAAGGAAGAPCPSWKGEFPVHGLDVEQRLSSYSQAGHWSLQHPFVSSATGSRLRCCQHCCSQRAHKLLGARLGVCQLGQVSPGRDVTWERCHLAQMSLGRGVTWQKCHLGELSLGSPVDS